MNYLLTLAAPIAFAALGVQPVKLPGVATVVPYKPGVLVVQPATNGSRLTAHDIQPTITVQQLQPTVDPQSQAHVTLQGSNVCIQACNEPQIQ